MADAICSVDPKYWDCPILDTDAHIKAALGDPIELPEYIDNSEWANLSDSLRSYLSHLECGRIIEHVRDNTYNSENDLSAEFIYTIFAPHDVIDWLWANNIYVAIEKHLGGDVRGNYSDFKVYNVDNIAETGLFDIVCGWNVEPVGFTNPSDRNLETINERLEIGWSSNPTSMLRDYLLPNTEPAYNKELNCYIGRLTDYPYPVKLQVTEPYYSL